MNGTAKETDRVLYAKNVDAFIFARATLINGHSPLGTGELLLPMRLPLCNNSNYCDSRAHQLQRRRRRAKQTEINGVK